MSYRFKVLAVLGLIMLGTASSVRADADLSYMGCGDAQCKSYWVRSDQFSVDDGLKTQVKKGGDELLLQSTDPNGKFRDICQRMSHGICVKWVGQLRVSINTLSNKIKKSANNAFSVTIYSYGRTSYTEQKGCFNGWFRAGAYYYMHRLYNARRELPVLLSVNDRGNLNGSWGNRIDTRIDTAGGSGRAITLIKIEAEPAGCASAPALWNS